MRHACDSTWPFAGRYELLHDSTYPQSNNRRQQTCGLPADRPRAAYLGRHPDQPTAVRATRLRALDGKRRGDHRGHDEGGGVAGKDGDRGATRDEQEAERDPPMRHHRVVTPRRSRTYPTDRARSS